MEILVGVLLGICAVLGVALFIARRKAGGGRATAMPGSALEGLRRVGELVVLRAYWSIPAIGEDHIFGEVGRKFLSWLWSQNKTIMIFRFEIRFKYDLRDPASVNVSPAEPGVLEVSLGKPSHEISLSDVRFFHTEKGQLLDWLLPRAVNIFQSDMDDQTRQKILEAAQESARKEAEKHADQLGPEARQSAEAILAALARSAGFADVRWVEARAAERALTP
ncbi:MAG TPA: DUF4230 domain-containing protein [Planctomycetota bacterium]|nr:DUF4230 domain-containing protein [Planctomycetota bacterium]